MISTVSGVRSCEECGGQLGGAPSSLQVQPPEQIRRRHSRSRNVRPQGLASSLGSFETNAGKRWQRLVGRHHDMVGWVNTEGGDGSWGGQSGAPTIITRFPAPPEDIVIFGGAFSATARSEQLRAACMSSQLLFRGGQRQGWNISTRSPKKYSRSVRDSH